MEFFGRCSLSAYRLYFAKRIFFQNVSCFWQTYSTLFFIFLQEMFKVLATTASHHLTPQVIFFLDVLWAPVMLVTRQYIQLQMLWCPCNVVVNCNMTHQRVIFKTKKKKKRKREIMPFSTTATLTSVCLALDPSSALGSFPPPLQITAIETQQYNGFNLPNAQ